MATASFRMQRMKDNGFRYASAVLQWIIEPLTTVEEKQRRRLRLLSAFLLLIAVNTLLGTLVLKNANNSSWVILLATSAILVVGYGLSRTIYHRLATMIAVGIPAFPILAMAFFSDNPEHTPYELPWLALPLLVSSLLLSLRHTIIITISYIVLVFLLMFFVDLHVAEIGESLAYMLVIFFFVVAITSARQQDQAEIENQLTQRQQMEESLKSRLEFEKTISAISSRFVSPSDIDDTISKALADIGRFSGASRAYLFLFREDNIHADNTHEWCAEGVSAQIDNNQNIPTVGQWWMEPVRQGKLFQIEDVSQMPAEAEASKAMLESQEIKSMLLSSVYDSGESVFGFMGFDDVVAPRKWSDAACTILSMSSQIIGNAIRRQQAEEALRESDEKYRTLAESSLTGIFIGQDEKYVFVNDRFAKIHGYTIQEILGKHHSMLVHPDDDKVVAQKEAKRLAGQAVPQQYKVRRIRKDGKTIWCEMVATLIEYRGKPAVLGNLIDITERQQMEESLRESEEFSTSLMENAPNPIEVLNPDTSIKYVNPAFEKLTGFTAAEVLGVKAPFPWYTEELKEQYTADIKKSMIKAGNNRRRIERVFQKKSGERFWVALNTALIHHDGIIKYHLANWLEITEQKKWEEKLEKAMANLEHANAQLADTNKEMEAFSYSVSHDLRTPLRTIDGFSQALLEDYPDNLDETGQNYLRRLRAASQKMGVLIDDLLKLSRLSRSEMHQEEVDLSALAREVADELKQTQPKRRTEVIISQGLTATGDRQLLRAALANLLGNAWKFTGKRRQARIEFGATSNGDKKAYFVRDNGAGFDMTYADKLFGAFQRLHDVAEFPGTGIGLATVQRIIHRHGGRVWAEGQVGEGATFYFTLS